MSDYAPGEEQLIQHYRELSETVSGEATVGKQNTEVARRTIAKIKADAWDEGYETGCSSPYGTATPSGKSYDPEPNPYRE